MLPFGAAFPFSRVALPSASRPVLQSDHQTGPRIVFFTGSPILLAAALSVHTETPIRSASVRSVIIKERGGKVDNLAVPDDILLPRPQPMEPRSVFLLINF